MQKMVKQMKGYTDEQAIPVGKRLDMANSRLRSEISSLKEIRVAVYTIWSICNLHHFFCEQAIYMNSLLYLLNYFMRISDPNDDWNQNQTAQIMHNVKQIVEIGVQAIYEMLKCSTARTKEHLDKCVTSNTVICIANFMTTYHNYPMIVTTCMKILRRFKKIEPNYDHFVVIPELLDFAETSILNLPPDDMRVKEFEKLRKVLSLHENLLLVDLTRNQYQRDLVIAQYTTSQLLEISQSTVWNKLSPETTRALLQHSCKLNNQ
ncbi:hypothetical protein PMAYCL1PPCAC_14103 [Pristionchus mayeri]|uniref:Uncharacterized protein n=1 Tax=Pristionchus mayeri TaxID=1317129 RepID=A0AAN5CAA5_9BILA|nr:hypothetical protein PMAYCL1PPCAC_14103 [Pristionchus mayeri]